jgi:hypothetical protein
MEEHNMTKVAPIIRSILGNQYEETPTILRRPAFLGDKCNYDWRSLQRRLKYADNTLRHPITKPWPRLERRLCNYRDALILILSDAEWKKLRQQNPRIRRRDQWNQVLEFDRASEDSMTYPAQSEDDQEMQEQILSYQRRLFHLRYPAACPDAWTELDTPFWDTLALYIRKEQASASSQPSTVAQSGFVDILSSRCARYGIDARLFLQNVAQYKSPVFLPRHGIHEALLKGKFRRVAWMLQNDYAGVEAIVPHGRTDILNAIRREIKRQIDTYFQDVGDDLQSWSRWKIKGQRKKTPEERLTLTFTQTGVSPAQIAIVATSSHPEEPFTRPDTPAPTERPRANLEAVYYRPLASAKVIARCRYRFDEEFDCPALRTHRCNAERLVVIYDHAKGKEKMVG